MKRVLKYIIAIVTLSVIIILTFSKKTAEKYFEPRDYQDIINSGILNAVTEYNAISFYVDNDTISGFDYELLNAFALEKGLKVKITPEMSFKKRVRGIMDSEFDILATGTATTSELKDSIFFTHHFALGKQVLIQKNDSSTFYIKSLLDMAGKTIHTIKDSPAVMRINNLMNEIADTIYIKEITRYGTEQLMAMVSAGDIDYAVCDENTAKSYIANYTNLDISTDVSFNQFYSWGVNRKSPVLLDSLNSWIDRFVKTKEYKILYNKYFNRKQ